MVVRKKKYQSGEASNFVTRKQALHKLQLNLKVSHIYHCHLNPSTLHEYTIMYSFDIK